MPDHFREWMQEMQGAGHEIVAASQRLAAAAEHINRAIDRALVAHEEQNGLRETVHRLEALVIELVQKQRERDQDA